MISPTVNNNNSVNKIVAGPEKITLNSLSMAIQLFSHYRDVLPPLLLHPPSARIENG